MESSSPSVVDDREASRGPLLERRQQLTDALGASPYDLIIYLERAVVYSNLAYPDLAAGDAYRALLLADEAREESFEYHDRALEALKGYSTTPCPDVLQHGNLILDLPGLVNGGGLYSDENYHLLANVASVRCFQILSLSLLLCGCLQSALRFCERGLDMVPHNRELREIKGYIEQVARRRLRMQPNEPVEVSGLPDGGVVRREVYPWNTYEPDRFSEESLSFLNKQLSTMAPKCEVRVSKLPVLLEGESSTDGYEIIPTCSQLGVFAKEDIAPGEAVLEEYSLLTANNRHKESTCDACGTELPPLQRDSKAVSCPDCYDTIFCDDFCFSKAQEQYHPAVCDKDVDSIAKDPDARDADQSLYLLLLARLLAMSSHQDIHPLQVKEIMYIWGDFVPTHLNDIDCSVMAEPPPEWTLPFNFKYNVEIPLHILEKMDVDIYATLEQHDLWVFNTAYSKFRGTASARKNPRDGRPDVAAVHPLWCLANHDCDPNVTWEWGGRMVLWAREKRVLGDRLGGIRAGEEILNHYCDVDLPVQQRREWARGSLGGWCMCQRCRDEAAKLKKGLKLCDS
ncbi:SET domain-containing protein [Madurella fahalii]|uniref:SET domain-containing protein n=1 Tax=Madurella fahalii TaxID=1157608 RepID=A0ABQ0GSA0_9PEZI